MDFFIQLFTDPVGFYNGHELLIAQIGVNAILAISLFVTFYSGQLTLANAGFMAVGAYTTVIMSLYLPFPLPVDILAGTLLAGAAGFLVGLPVLRLRGIFLAIATIGFVEALRLGVILNLPITGEGQGLKNPGADPLGGIVPILVSLPIIAYLVWRLTRAKLGHAWAAIREDELAASSNGINVPLYKMIAFVIGALLAGYAGALETHINFFVDPTEYSVTRAIQILTFAVAGGTTNVLGPIVGALFLTSLPEIIRQASAYRDVVNGVILILVIIFRPQGIVAGGGFAVHRPRWWPENWRLRGRAARAN
ncbi:MAG TPA: branched-chain amino acid ABC transporter permease [Candidatus Dormibacteraeota bacterium]|nr:branched-chain amino acid ABC transporter permease [Candidatus Dormibacteraeota bacterium]